MIPLHPFIPSQSAIDFDYHMGRKRKRKKEKNEYCTV